MTRAGEKRPEHSFKYGREEYGYDVLWDGRKLLEIAVHPDRSVVVKAPEGKPLEQVRERVERRAHWIVRQINHFRQFEPRTPPRQFVGGESHLYLGRKYRLKISDEFSHRGVRLHNGWLRIACGREDSARAQRLLERWYRRRAAALLPGIVEACWAALGMDAAAPRPPLSIRRMRTRWGSMSPAGRLTLNLRLIEAPRECIEYVVMHELCHLRHPRHGQQFRALLSRLMPDWQRRKHRLERTLA